MFGLDESIAASSDGASIWIVLAVAVLLGLRHAHPPAHGARTGGGAFTIGLLHGMGGSGGVGVLVLASVRSTGLAVISLVLLAVFTAVSMSLLSSGFGSMLVSRPARAAFGGV